MADDPDDLQGDLQGYASLDQLHDRVVVGPDGYRRRPRRPWHVVWGGRNQGLRWYHRFAEPLESAALGLWSATPYALRRPLFPLERLFGPHTTAGEWDPAYEAANAVDVVPGVIELRARGFVPLEEHTGFTDIGRSWPADHARSVPETRPAFLEHESAGAVVWLARSPWPDLDVPAVLDVAWTWAERDPDPQERESPDGYQRRAAEVFAWDRDRAVAWHRRLFDDPTADPTADQTDEDA